MKIKTKLTLIFITLVIVINFVYIMSLQGQIKVLEYRLETSLIESLQQALKDNAIEIIKDNVEVASKTPSNSPKNAHQSVVLSKDVVCQPSKNNEVNLLLNKYFKTCSEVKTIWSIAQSENRGKQIGINKNNKNGSWDCGWLQINTVHRNKGESFQSFCDRMHNLEENIKMASKIYNDRKRLTGDGFEAWVTYNNDLHLAYLK